MPFRLIFMGALLTSLIGQAVIIVEARDELPASAGPAPATRHSDGLATARDGSGECGLTSGPTHHVTEILNARSIRLDDGSVLHLSGIETPQRIISVQSMTGSDRPHQAIILYLEKLVLGRAVELRSARHGRSRSHSHARDRHNRIRAHVFVLRGGERLWLQGELVRSGLALAGSERGDRNNACVKKLQAFEREARDNARGNWGNRIFRVLDAANPKEIARYDQTFQLVEGRVRRLSEFNNKLYLNFGHDWKTDFTVVIGRYILRRMKSQVEELKRLKGKTVRVRGWVELRKGPLISLTAAHDLEILQE